jgi:hypothetical protein
MSFNSGELSPKLEGRIDLSRYYNGVHEMTNWICLPQGGAKTRGGFHFAAETKFGDSSVSLKESRLIPFRFSELQNYQAEFGDQYIRFFMNSGQIMIGDTVELVTNGTFPADITGWTNLSTGTGSIAFHTNHMNIAGGATGVGWAEQKITVVDGTLYLLEFDVAAYPLTVRIGKTTGAQDILKDTVFAVGTNRQLFIIANGTAAFIQYRNPNNNTADLDNVSMQLAVAYEIASPSVPYLEEDIWGIKYDQDDENLYLVHGDYPPRILTRTDHTAWTCTAVEFIDGPYLDEETSPVITVNGTPPNVTLDTTVALFNVAGHIGALWRLKKTTWGYVKLIADASNSTTHFHATVISTLGGTGAQDAWREGCWSPLNGYPRTITFHEGRAVYASTYEQPQTVWGSKTYHAEIMTPGTLADDPYTFTAKELNIIRWICQGKHLALGALNGEGTAVGPTDTAISPTDPPLIKSETPHGSADIQPLRIGKAILFLQKSGTKIREFVYKYEDDGYRAPDITRLADHLMESGLIDFTYQQEPDSIVWALTTSGDYLLGCTYDRLHPPEDIVGWHKHPTDGYFESVSTIPYQKQDQLWAIIRRTINGVTKRYVEYYDPDISVDCGLTYSGIKATTIWGLLHLVGKTVQIVGDGAWYPPQVVPATGKLTIDPGASEIYVGIKYSPRLVTNRPEVQLGGTSQGLLKRWNKIIVRVLNTMGIAINGQALPARSSLDLMDEAPEPTNGDVSIRNLGFDRDGRIIIEQPLPLPAHIVCITGSLTIGDD